MRSFFVYDAKNGKMKRSEWMNKENNLNLLTVIK